MRLWMIRILHFGTGRCHKRRHTGGSGIGKHDTIWASSHVTMEM